MHFRGCIVNDVEVAVGDYVFINVDDPDNTDKAFIAQITELFDNGQY